MKVCTLSVGADACDIVGFSNTHIQCAIDRVAMLGGGRVTLSAGTFHMADALHLRTGVAVSGQGDATMLRKNRMKCARITTFLGFGHDDVCIDAADVFEPGDGVIVSDDNSVGFYQTSGTLCRRTGNTWFIDRPFAHDYRADANAVVKSLYPLVSAVDITDAAVSDLVLDGNAAENERMNACRGSGFFAHRADRIHVHAVVVRDYNGDGFGFQTCDDFRMEDCLADRCSGNGFHPGSGSNRFHLRRVTGRHNGGCGLFYSLRVRDSILEDSTFEGNAGDGVSINSRDTGHINRNLTLRHNGGAGICFVRRGPMAAPHGNSVEHCLFDANARDGGEADLVLQGEPSGVRIVNNRIRRGGSKPGILIRPEMPAFEADDNIVEPADDGAVIDLRQPSAEV